MRVETQPAYLLHSRPYRDTSLLLELITPEFGRVSAVARGVRGQSKSAKARRSILTPFLPLTIGWSGNSDLKTINRFEAAGLAVPLRGDRLYSGIYVNELFTRLIQHYDGHPQWYELYQKVMRGLYTETSADIVLREFEFELLQELGYGIDLMVEGVSGEPITADYAYFFGVDEGFSRCANRPDSAVPDLFEGADLLALAAGHYSATARRAAKRLCRLALAAQLGEKPLKSRELFS